jgi:hypothetical protein
LGENWNTLDFGSPFPMRSTCLALVAVTLWLASATANTSTAASASKPPTGLTASGRLLWNFEALLRQTFGAGYQGCLEYLNRYTLSFTKDSYCRSHSNADTMYYRFTFKGASSSAFHVVARTFRPAAFGNYPEPIRVERNYVACDPAGHTFLISYGDVYGLSANLACLTPTP